MRRLGRLRTLVLMVFLAAGSGVGCTSPKPSLVPRSHPASAPAGPQTFSVSVDAVSGVIPLVAEQYFPSEVQVHPGDTIKFNEVWSGEPHTVTLGSLVDQGPTSTALPAFFPRPGQGNDPVPSASHPCFLDTGTPPAKTACPKLAQPSFSGGRASYSSGWLPPA